MFDLSTLNELGLTRPQTQAPQTQGRLQQEAFLELMMAQFRNQDPFKPMENGEFLGQLAQFGTVSGIEDLKTSMGTLAASLYSDQALQASGLIGRSVLVPGGQGVLSDGGDVSGAVDLAEPATSVSILVTDANGALVRRMELGAQQRGMAEFRWDGLNGSGERQPDGVYRIAAVVSQSGTNRELPVFTEARVDSVVLGNSGGVILSLAGLGELALTDVRRIGSGAQQQVFDTVNEEGTNP